MGCLLDAEEGLAGYPTVGDGLVVGFTGALANDYIESVVAQIKALSRALHAIAQNCYCFACEYFASFIECEFFASDDGFFHAAKIQFCHIVYYKFLFFYFLPLYACVDKAFSFAYNLACAFIALATFNS